MKRKNIYFLIPVLILVLGFIITKSLNDKSLANGDDTPLEGVGFVMSFKNLYSHYSIVGNGDTTPVGTKYLYSSTTGGGALVYCAEQGVNLGDSSIRYTLEHSNVGLQTDIKNKLNLMMPYTYPYLQLTEIKKILKNSDLGLDGSDYLTYEFDKLNAQESITASQAAIWNIIENTDTFKLEGKIPKEKIDNAYTTDTGNDDINTLTKFRTCEQYHSNGYISKNNWSNHLTTEEKLWYDEDGCNPNGKFYNNVFKLHDMQYEPEEKELDDEAQQKVKNRVDALIDWYTKTLITKLTALGNQNIDPTIEVESKKFYKTGDTLSLNITFKTNMDSYTVIFRKSDNSRIIELDNSMGNTFTINNLPLDTTEIIAEIKQYKDNGQVYYYNSAGQDFIGYEHYITKLNISNDGVVEEGKIAIYKVDSESDKIEISYDKTEVDNTLCGTGCLVDAAFSLYDSNKKLIQENIKTINGGLVLTNIEVGTYYLKEINPPKGYEIYNYNTDLVDSDGFIKFEVKTNSITSIVVSNKKNKICFLKVDKNDNSKILGGAEFEIKDVNGNVVETFVTKDNESTCFEGKLANETYYLYEKTPPANYLKVYDVYKFTIGSNQNIPTDNITLLEPVNGVITITNTPGVGVSKSDITTGTCVSGAELTVKDKNGKIVDEWISSCENGRENHILTLEPGTYTLIESSAPLGYATAESIEFTINSDGKVDKQLNMKDSPIDVCILKISKDKKIGLSGAEFEIYDSNGTLYEKFISGSTCTSFKYMPVGEYTIKEIKAPDGYKLNGEEIKITIKDTRDVQIFEIENEMEVPKTAMDYSKVILIIAILFMTFGLAFVFYYGYKKDFNKKM